MLTFRIIRDHAGTYAVWGGTICLGTTDNHLIAFKSALSHALQVYVRRPDA